MAEGAGTGISSELKFFEEFSKNKGRVISVEDDGIQLRSTSCYVNEYDFDGEVTDCALHYLYSHQCPQLLAAAVARVTRDELKLADLSDCQLQENGETHTVPVLDANKLQDVVRHKVHEICEQWQNDPIFTTEKQSLWPVSTCAVKNTRRRMEDRHVLIPNLNIFFGLEDKSPQGFFAIFDGHAGTEAASYASAHLHHHIVRHPNYSADIHAAVKDGFKKTDDLFIEKCKRENLKCGCTAVCALIREDALYVAWVGDSQAFLIEKGRIKDIVTPHRPSREDERKRVEEQGGCVVYFGTWRVNGTLAISRAIGDSEFKPYVSSEPDIVTIPRVGSEDFLIMACDGLWDVATPEDAALIVYECLNSAPDNIDDISERLVQLAVQRGSSDNITIIVIFLRDPKEILKDGVPNTLINALNVDKAVLSQQESKLPRDITTGESPTKISNSLWMNDAAIPDEEAALDKSRSADDTDVRVQVEEPSFAKSRSADDNDVRVEVEEPSLAKSRSADDNDDQVEMEPKVEPVSEYFLLQSEEETKNKFSVETLNLESNNQISLSSFDSSGVMATPTTTPTPTPTSPQSSQMETESSPQIVPIEDTLAEPNLGALETDASVFSHSNLSPSAPEFIPHSFVNPMQPEVTETKLEADYDGLYSGAIFVGPIPDSAPVAEDVVDDESEEGEDWRYLKGSGDVQPQQDCTLNDKMQSPYATEQQLDLHLFNSVGKFSEQQIGAHELTEKIFAEITEKVQETKVFGAELGSSAEIVRAAAECHVTDGNSPLVNESLQLETCLIDTIVDEPKERFDPGVELAAEPVPAESDLLMAEFGRAEEKMDRKSDDHLLSLSVTEDFLEQRSCDRVNASYATKTDEDQISKDKNAASTAGRANTVETSEEPHIAIVEPASAKHADSVPSPKTESVVASLTKVKVDSTFERKLAATKSSTKTIASKPKVSAPMATAKSAPRNLAPKPSTGPGPGPGPALGLAEKKTLARSTNAKTDKPLLKTRPVTTTLTTANATTTATTSASKSSNTTQPRTARNVACSAPKVGLRKIAPSVVAKTTVSTSTVTGTTSTKTTVTSTTSTAKRVSTFPRNASTKTTAAAAAAAAATSNTKDSKECVNKQILKKNQVKITTTTTTTTNEATKTGASKPTSTAQKKPALTRPSTLLKKAASASATAATATATAATTTATATATAACATKQKRPATAPPARPRTRTGTAGGLKSKPERGNKEKGTLDEKTKEQVVVPPEGVGRGDEASVCPVNSSEECANPNVAGSGDPANLA